MAPGLRARATVYYDGACPLCSREVAFYRQRVSADVAGWIDVSTVDEIALPPTLTKQAAMARFHVENSEGTLYSGGRAFAELWSLMPMLRPIGRLLRRKPFVWALEAGYRGFLVVRPRLQRLVSG